MFNGGMRTTMMTEISRPETSLHRTDRQEAIYRAASELLSRKADWAIFVREILGPEGIVRQSYPTPESLAGFKRTETYAEIQRMLAKLRQTPKDSSEVSDSSEEPTRMITIRLPRSLHETLRHEAHEHHTSMNKLCISKLLRLIDQELVPKDTRD